MFEKVFVDFSRPKFSNELKQVFYKEYKGGPAADIDELIILLKKYLKPLPADDFNINETRFFPFLYLVADEIVEAGFSCTDENRSDFIKQTRSFWEGRPNIIDFAKIEKGLYFSPSKFNKGMFLENQGITIKTSILLLAACGLEIALPNISLNISRSEELYKIRQSLETERREYLIAIAKIADETFNRLIEGYYKDTIDWATSEAFLKIQPKLEKFEISMKQLDKKLLERIGFFMFKEGAPTLCSTLLNKKLSDVGKEFAEILLKALCSNLSRNIEERKVPEVVYGFKLSKSIKPLKI